MSSNKSAGASGDTGKSSSGSKKSARNVSKELKKAMRREYMADPFKRLLNQMTAAAKRKRVVLTEPNPNAAETNKRYIKRVVTDQQRQK